MQEQPPFRLLLKLFQNRFVENDSVSPGGGFQPNIIQLIGVLATLSLFVCAYGVPPYVALSLRPPTPGTEWVLRGFRLFFAAYSFAIPAMAAIFHWDMLFPDRRDFLILAPFPIRLRDIAVAKFTALGLFLLMLVAVVNVLPDLVTAALGGLRFGAAQAAATVGASLFGFLAVVALQGVLINVTSVKIFRRISPWIQMLGMCILVMTLLGFLIYSALFPSAVEERRLWLYLLPPAWFSGLYEMILGGRNPVLDSLGFLALKMMSLAVVVVAVTWGFGFRRHFRRTLESEDAMHRPWGWQAPRWLLRNAEERTIFSFIGKTVARSQKHQFFLAAYLSTGLAVAVIVGTAVQKGNIALSPGGARAVAFIVGFFLISGLRAAFQFPTELSANWIFQITEARWTEVSRRATRKLVLGLTVIGSMLIALPYESEVWKWPVVVEHAVVEIIAAALLIEALFWSFDRVPFTCSYFPGRKSLPLLIILYVYGVTEYSFHLADLEAAIERRWTIALLFFAGAAAALAIAWRRRPAEEAVRFDGSEPAIQTIELT